MICRSFLVNLTKGIVVFIAMGSGFHSYTWAQQQPLLKIGQNSVSLQEFLYLAGKEAAIPGSPEESLSPEDVESNLELFIDYKLKVLEAEAQGLDETQAFQQEFDSFKETLKKPFLIKHSLEEGELRKAYSRMQEIIRASHILLRFPPKSSAEDSLAVLRMALKLKQDIDQGVPIEKLAIEYSEDPSVAKNNGDLGYFSALQMIQTFEDAAYLLQPGETSDPILTKFGYHLIQVKDRRPNPGGLQISHILIRTNEQDADSENRARRKISDIYAEIQKPSTSWEAIVETYSEDPSTNTKGGTLPWFTVGSMVPEIELAALSLEQIGEVSPPIKTSHGYHILRLEDRQALQSFEKMEPMIRSRVLRDSRSTLINSQELAIQKSRFGFAENEELVNQLRELLRGTSDATFASKIQSADLASKSLFRTGETSHPVAHFISYLEENKNPTASKTFELWYDRYCSAILSELEEKSLTQTNKDYQLLLKEYREGILLFSLMNQEVWQKGIQDSLGQREFFEKNRANYQWNHRAEAFIVEILQPQHREKAHSYLQNQVYSEDLQEKFRTELEEKHTLAYKVQAGLLEIPQHPVLSKADLMSPFQEIESNGKPFLVVIGNKFPPSPKNFEKTKGYVIRDYQDHLNQELVRKLREKYPVQINENVKKKALLTLIN